MAFVAEQVPVGARVLGFDTVEPLDQVTAPALARVFAFATRYVGLTEAHHAHAIDAAELGHILAAGMGCMFVQFARAFGWDYVTGKADGRAAARNVLALGVPPLSGLTCDMEGGFQSAKQAIEYGSAWYEAARTEGMGIESLQLYAGAGVPLSGDQLFNDLPFRGYWRPFSPVPDVARRSYRMIQLRPSDLVVAGVTVDLDVVETDRFGGRPWWVRASSPAVMAGG